MDKEQVQDNKIEQEKHLDERIEKNGQITMKNHES